MLFTSFWRSSLFGILQNNEDIFFLYDEAIADNLLPEEKTSGCPYIIGSRSSEQAKSLEQVERIWRFLYEHGATRHSVLVCIGGGTVTDIGGFAASTYKRGIRYVSIPTTLLSMVDASTGGKTGFNHLGVKNLIGTFYPPMETLIDTRWLRTLPYEEVLSGYAEMLKHGLLSGKTMWQALLATDCLENIEAKIRQSVSFKQQVVESDPQESGLRKILNFGHTIGHALEALSIENTLDTPLRHGYAVMQGMVAALYLSVVLCGLDRGVLRTMSHYMVEHYGRPSCACSDYDKLMSLMRQDKKNLHTNELAFTLLPEIGKPVTDHIVPETTAREALDYLFSL